MSKDCPCPICDSEFRSQAVVSTNSFGGKRTDFHERAAGTQPLPFLVHMCNRCGYSGSERDFSEEADVSPMLKEHVWNELAPSLVPSAVSGSEKYEAAAKVAEWQSMEPRHIADLPHSRHGIDVATATVVRVFQTCQTCRRVMHAVPPTNGASHLRRGNHATLPVNQVHLYA